MEETDFLSLYNRLHRDFKAGVINKHTLDQAMQLSRVLQQQRDAVSKAHPRDYYYGLCMCAEILDHFGRNRQAVELLRQEADLLHDLAQWKSERYPSGITEEKRLLREKVRLIAVYAGTVYYRGHEYRKALEWIHDCRDLVEKLRDEDFPCRGTLAQILDLQAKCHRQLHEFGEAERCFRKSIENYFDLAVRKETTSTGREEIAFATRRTAVLLSRLGWMALQSGNVGRAETFLLTAQLLLVTSQDEINRAYAWLIHASILRVAEFSDPARWGQAITLARQAQRAFGALGHERYQTRATYEHALCHLHGGQQGDAKRLAIQVKEWAEKNGDVPWKCNALLVLSRVALMQGEVEQAQALAEEAIANAEDHVTPRIDALIARAEALLAPESPARAAEARRALQQALQLNHSRGIRNEMSQGQSVRLDAVIYLLLARSYVQEGMSAKATEHFNLWRRLEGQIEQAPIRTLARLVADEIAMQQENFIIHLTPDMSLDFHDYRPRLLKFLIQRAHERVEARLRMRPERDGKPVRVGKELIARELNIKRQTLIQWEKQIRNWESQGQEGEPA